MEITAASQTAFTVDIGGLCITVQCPDIALQVGLRRQYLAFLTDEVPQLTVHVSQSGQDPLIDVVAGYAQLAPTSDQPLEEVDYFLRIALAHLAGSQRGMLFHAAGIQRHGLGYAFFGHSGSGKTTVARLSSDDRVLNDDLVLLMPHKGGWTMHATPFSNPTQVQPRGPHSAPLTGLLRLIQDRKVYLEPVTEAQAVAEVIASTPVVAADPLLSGSLLQRVVELVRAIPTYRLHFLPDASFWAVVDAIENAA